MRALPVALVLLAVAVARPAAACWDGDTAAVGGVAMYFGAYAQWEPAVVIDRATWLSRIDAALPAGSTMIIDGISASCTDGPCDGFESRHGQGELAAVLRDVRRAFPHVRARSARVAPLTIQIFAGDARTARGIADRVWKSDGHGDWHGFYEAGGFPNDNSPAHVLAAGKLHRVVVGAFLSRADATPVLQALAHAGFHGFVRPIAGAGMPDGA